MNAEATIMQILVNDVLVSVPQSQIGLDDNLREILGLDSLGFAELRTQCEYTFGVTITDDDFAPGNFASVRTLTDLVTRLRESIPDEESSR
jgi:acyl carrier protein